jgi:hypothetical protein
MLRKCRSKVKLTHKESDGVGGQEAKESEFVSMLLRANVALSSLTLTKTSF